MISEAFFMPKRRVFNSSLAWLAAARATEKLRNSGGVAHIADFVRNGMLPCVTLGTMTVASGEITGRDCLKREGGQRWLSSTMS